MYAYIYWLVVSTPLKNIKVRLDHHPDYWGKQKMFQTTNQYKYIYIYIYIIQVWLVTNFQVWHSDDYRSYCPEQLELAQKTLFKSI